MQKEDFDFSLDFIQWCNDNGVTDKDEIKKLFAIVEKYYVPLASYKPAKSFKEGSYPDYRALRKSRYGLKMETVANEVGISEVQMHYIETRKTTFPNPDTLSKLNIYYGLTDKL